MARPDKEAIVSEVRDKIQKANGVVLTDFRGLNVQELAELRRSLRHENIEYKVYKNTLARIAVSSIELKGLLDFLEGPTAIAFGYDDAVATAKMLAEFSQEHSSLTLKGGVIEGRIIDGKAMKVIATLPSRDVLLAQSVSLIQAPIRNLAGVLQGLIQAFVSTLSQIAEDNLTAK